MSRVFYWADGTWATEEEYRLEDWSWKSDDYGTIDLPEGVQYNDEYVEQLVQSLIM